MKKACVFAVICLFILGADAASKHPLTFADVPKVVAPEKCEGMHLFSQGIVGDSKPNTDGTVTVTVMENVKEMGAFGKEYDGQGFVGTIRIQAKIVLAEDDAMKFTKLDTVNIAGDVVHVAISPSHNIHEIAIVTLELKGAKIRAV